MVHMTDKSEVAQEPGDDWEHVDEATGEPLSDEELAELARELED